MGKHLHDVMGWPGPLTGRQFATWRAWLAAEWNNPSRTDCYLMQLACEVRRVLAKNPDKVKLNHFRLKFRDAAPRPVSPEARRKKAEAEAAAWLAAFGVGLDVLNPPALRGGGNSPQEGVS